MRKGVMLSLMHLSQTPLFNFLSFFLFIFLRYFIFIFVWTRKEILMRDSFFFFFGFVFLVFIIMIWGTREPVLF